MHRPEAEKLKNFQRKKALETRLYLQREKESGLTLKETKRRRKSILDIAQSRW